MVALVLLVVGWAGGAWAQDASSTAVAEVLDADGTKVKEYTALATAVNEASANSAANSGANWTVRCLTDYDCNESLIVNPQKEKKSTSVTLDLNGHKINLLDYTNGAAIMAKLKITDGATGGELNCEYTMFTGVSSSTDGVYMGEIEFASGTYNIATLDVPGILTISGGKLNVNNTTTIGGSPSTIKRNITGGFIKENYTNKVLRQCVNENCMVEENTYLGDGYYAVIPVSAVALNYDADGALSGWYDTFSDAMTNATDGTTVRMCGDCEVDGAEVAKGKSIHLNLNGQTLTTKSYNSFNVYGSLTISDESASQSGTLKGSSNFLITVNKNAKLNIASGNFTNTRGYLFYNFGTINISGGKFSYTNGFSQNSDGFTMSICGGFFNKKYVTEATPSNYNWTPYIANGFVYIYDKSIFWNYPYYVARGAALTYGNGTTAGAAVSNGVLTLDLKDDESDHNAWVSKIETTGDIENIDVTVKKNFANTKWHAFYAPFDINVTSDQSFEVAKIWDTELNRDDNSTLIEFIQLKDGESIPAFTPCLIKAKATGKQDIVFKNVTVKATNTTAEPIECSNVDERFTFTGVLENTSITDLYALDSETGNLVQASSETAKVTPMKFFMTVDSKTPVTSIKSKRFAVRVIGDETTGISDINSEAAAKADGAVYNLQGVKMGTSLNGLPAGLYIVNGRKVAVK